MLQITHNLISPGGGKSYDAEIEELNKKLQFSDWVIEQSGDRLNFYRKYFTESEV